MRHKYVILCNGRKFQEFFSKKKAAKAFRSCVNGCAFDNRFHFTLLREAL